MKFDRLRPKESQSEFESSTQCKDVTPNLAESQTKNLVASFSILSFAWIGLLTNQTFLFTSTHRYSILLHCFLHVCFPATAATGKAKAGGQRNLQKKLSEKCRVNGKKRTAPGCWLQESAAVKSLEKHRSEGSKAWYPTVNNQLKRGLPEDVSPKKSYLKFWLIESLWFVWKICCLTGALGFACRLNGSSLEPSGISPSKVWSADLWGLVLTFWGSKRKKQKPKNHGFGDHSSPVFWCFEEVLFPGFGVLFFRDLGFSPLPIGCIKYLFLTLTHSHLEKPKRRWAYSCNPFRKFLTICARKCCANEEQKGWCCDPKCSQLCENGSSFCDFDWPSFCKKPF